MLMEVDFSNDLQKIIVPVLIMWGVMDSFISRADQDALRTNIKNSTLIFYERTGHALHWEEPQRFINDAILKKSE